MRMRSYVPRVGFVILLAAWTAHAEQPYPFTGTWKLNVAKSRFGPGQAPRSNSVTVASDGTVTFEGVGSDGKPIKRSHPASVGKEVPMDGIQSRTIITTRKGNVLDDTIKVDGQTVQTVHAVFSRDGRTITAKRDGKDLQGRPLHNVEVYEK